MLLGKRLKYARERAGLTMAQVKGRTKIGTSSLSEYEGDHREPSLAQLQLLGRVYNRPVEYFLSEAPPPKETVLWREEPIENALEMETRFLQLCGQYNNLEIWNDDRMEAELPIVRNQQQPFSYQDAENLANDVRRILALGDHPGQMLLNVLEEKCGIKVFHELFHPTGTAACAVHENFGLAVLLNSGNKRWRRNFDLAHELFHLLTWEQFRVATEEHGNVAGRDEEKFANYFASVLLMPADAVKRAVGARVKNNSMERIQLFDIAREFDVSVDALIWRLKKIYNLDQALCEEMKNECALLSPRYDNKEDSLPSVHPTRYRLLAIRALHKGEMSLGKFAQYMGISRREAQSYQAEEDGCGEIQLITA